MEFFDQLPSAIQSTPALVAYVVGAIVALLAGHKLRMASILSKQIRDIPAAERRRALEIAAGTVLPKTITADQWIRLKRMQAVTGILGAILIVILALAAIALTRSNPDVSQVIGKQQETLDLLKYKLVAPKDFRPSLDVSVNVSSRYMDFRPLLAYIRTQIAEFEPESRSLPNGWTVELDHSQDAPPVPKKIHISLDDPMAAQLVFKWDRLALASVHFVFVQKNSTYASTQELPFAGMPDRSDIGIAYGGGRRELIVDAASEMLTLRIVGLTSSDDFGDQTWVTKPISTVLDLDKYLLRVSVVPVAPGADYNVMLDADPFPTLERLSFQASEADLLTVPKSLLVTLPNWATAPQFVVRFPTNRGEIIAMLGDRPA